MEKAAHLTIAVGRRCELELAVGINASLSSASSVARRTGSLGAVIRHHVHSCSVTRTTFTTPSQNISPSLATALLTAKIGN